MLRFRDLLSKENQIANIPCNKDHSIPTAKSNKNTQIQFIYSCSTIICICHDAVNVFEAGII